MFFVSTVLKETTTDQGASSSLLVFGGASIDVLFTELVHPFQGHPCLSVLSFLDLASKVMSAWLRLCLTHKKKKTR